MNAEEKPKGELAHNIELHFAWLRTRLSAERTLEAWVRTAVALIGFGFTIVQFFKRLDVMSDVHRALRPGLAHYMGLTLIAIGTIALAISIWQYTILIKHLKAPPFEHVAVVEGMPHFPMLLMVAATLCLAGVLTFAAILLRMQ